MKFRLTPFNIIIAFAIAVLVITLFQPVSDRPPQIFAARMQQWFLVGLIVVSFITDLIFRFTLITLKKIWIVEFIFIVLLTILFLILQK